MEPLVGIPFGLTSAAIIVAVVAGGLTLASRMPWRWLAILTGVVSLVAAMAAAYGLAYLGERVLT
jgi:hypothetical protein